jgi:PIN domain nuclease of toxin-antitoxin system
MVMMMAWDNNTVDGNSKDIADLFTPVVELEIDDGLHMGVYGPSKMGKTTFCTTAPLPQYWIDTESNMKKEAKKLPKDIQEQIFVSEVLKWATVAQGGKKKKKIDLVASMEMAFDAMDALTDKVTQMNEEKKKRIEAGEEVTHGAPGTMIIDSATDIWKWISLWKDQGAGGKLKKTKSGSIPRYEWGHANERYAEFIYMLLTSGWHVIMTFRSQQAVNNKGEDVGYLKARWQKDTDYWLDLIMEANTDGVDFVWKFKGDRFGKISGSIANPTWDTLLQRIHDESGVDII